MPRPVGVALSLAPTAASVPLARRAVRDALPGWDLEVLVDPACLVVSELVTNAVLHARSQVDLSLQPQRDGSLRLEVADASATPPRPRSSGGGGTTGRGLAIVSELADDWGVQVGAGGKTVWAVLHPYGRASGVARGTTGRG